MKKDNGNLIGGIIIALIAIVGICIFLFGHNSSTDPVTGAQVLAHQGAGYFLSMFLWLAVAGACLFAGVKIYKKEQKVGYLIVSLIVAGIFLTIAVGKGCTDKANDGVTSPAGRVINK